MAVYYGMILALFLVQLAGGEAVRRGRLSGRQLERGWLVLAWLVLSLVQGLRCFTEGTDTEAYVYYFTTQRWHTSEVGFKLLNRLLYQFTQNPTVYLLLMALLINGLVVWAVRRMSEQPFVSIYCYVLFFHYFHTFNAMRQFLAVGLLLHAFYYARCRKWGRFLLAEALACCFHTTAVVGLCFLFVPLFDWVVFHGEPLRVGRRQAVRRRLAWAGLAAVAAWGALRWGVPLMARLLPQYQSYLTSAYFTEAGGWRQPVVYTVLYLAFVLLTDTRTPQHRTWVMPLLILVALSFAQLRAMMLARILWYFEPYLMFAVAHIWQSSRLTPAGRPLLRYGITALGLAYMTFFLMQGAQGVGHYALSFV